MHQLDWGDLRIFLAVARAGGFVPAARRLGIDHTTVARRMTHLERASGEALLHRTPRGSTLTEAGRTLVQHVERMELEALSALEQMGAQGEAASGVVRIATPEAFGSCLLAPAMSRLHERHPGITIELAPEARSVSLSKREADIAIALARPPKGRLVAQKLTDYRLCLYGSRSYLQAASEIRSAADLRNHPFVWYIDELVDLPQLKFLDQVAAGIEPAFRSSSIVAQQAAVAGDLGLGMLHGFAAETDPRLVRVLPEIFVERSYWLVVHADQRRLPRIRAVIDFIQTLVREQRPRFSPP